MLSLGLSALTLLAACSVDNVSAPGATTGRITPTGPHASLLPTGVTVNPGDTYWDFVDLNGTAYLAPFNYLTDAYTSKALTNGVLGTITLTTDRPTGNASIPLQQPWGVSFKWASDDQQIGDEKGVGTCYMVGDVTGAPAGTVACGGASEIDQNLIPVSGTPVSLLVDLSKLAPGVTVTSVVITSLQSGDAYTFALCTTSSSGCGSAQSGVGLGGGKTIYQIPISQGTSQWMRFSPNAVDYLVAGVTTTSGKSLNDQGCSPGYWKNHSSWPSPYTPGEQFGAVFANAFPGMTMQQVISQGGGGLKALGRQTVSALMNSSQLGYTHYGMTAQQVIDAFNAAYASGNYNTLESKFDSMTDVNGRSCPLS